MRGDKDILNEISRNRPCDLAISAITFAEIHYGIGKSPHKKEERKKKIESIVSQIQVIPFDKDAAFHYSTIRVYLEENGIPISERDLQIASIARSKILCVVTHNIKEYSKIPKLNVEDWYKG